MAVNSDIKHQGRVISVSGDMVDVLVESLEACGSCKSKSICGMGDRKEMLLSIEVPVGGIYQTDEIVNVTIKQVMGMKAVFFAYILPFVIVLLSLVFLLQTSVGELFSGLISIGVLVFYYFLLYLLRGKLEKEINFGIEKI